MGIISNAMLIISGVYLALGLIYLRFWLGERSRRDYLAFGVCALFVSLYAWCEIGMMRSQTPTAYLFYAKWSFVVGAVFVTAIAWFAYTSLYGRRWPFYVYCALRAFSLVIHEALPNGINFIEITGIGQTSFAGESLAYPIAIRNPWMVLPQLLHFYLVVYCMDASIRTWRSGNRRRAVIVGTGILLFGLTILATGINLFLAFISIPIFVSFSIFFVIGPILYELNYDMHRAAMLSEKLEEREARLSETLEYLQLSAAAGSVGMWTRKVGDEEIWASEKAGEIWGLPRGATVSRAELLQHIHPDDRELFATTSRELEGERNDFRTEYRMVLSDGEVRWLQTSGKVDEVNGSRIIRGAVVDITKLKLAENAIRELGQKLVDAQEKERARLAFELHDDLNQSIALLTIKLTVLQDRGHDLASVKDELNAIVSDLQRLSRDVHRISHELHPSKLEYLGLEAAVKALCREFSSKHKLEVDFASKAMPGDLSRVVSLCLYRITQESLNNLVRHSGAEQARVDLTWDPHEIRLSVLDNGKGFDVEAARAKGGLGLISMTERARHVNGRVDITSSVGAGARIEVRIPLERHAGVAAYARDN